MTGISTAISLFHPALERALELSSMGIRVDEAALSNQLKLAGCEHWAEFSFHKELLAGICRLLSAEVSVNRDYACISWKRFILVKCRHRFGRSTSSKNAEKTTSFYFNEVGGISVEQVDIKKLFRNHEAYIDQNIRVSGWIRTIRDSKNFAFIELNDGTFFKNLQIVIDDSLPNFSEVVRLNISSAIVAEGKLVESPGAKQPFELKAEKITVEGASLSDYPLQKKRHSFEYLRTIAHLRPRTNTFQQYFACGPWQLTLCISSSRSGISSMFTPRSLQAVMRKGPGRCFSNNLRL